MKKLLGFLVLILLVGGFAHAQVRQGRNAWVSARAIALKSSTGFFSSETGTVFYGDEVSVLQVSGNWAQVRPLANSSLSGWISTANLSTRRLTETGGAGSATASEVALGGKGFNQEVENTYKAKGNLNYADVDRTEAITVSQEELLKFVTEGRLAQGGN